LKTILKTFGAILIDTGGQEIAEAAVVLPLLFLVLLAILSFGRAYNVYSTVVRAAQDGATVAAASQCGLCGNAQTSDSQVVTAVTSALAASKVAPGQVIAYTPTPTPVACPGILPAGGCVPDGGSNITICRNVQLNPSSTGPKQCGSIVSFRYPYQFSVPFASINMQQIQMTAVAERQMEN
jgi:TadE-like protein